MRFCHCRGFNETSGDLFYEVDFTVLLLFVAYLLLCLRWYAARGEVSSDVGWTGSGHILGNLTDNIGVLSGGLATETDSVGTLASSRIAWETDIMGRPAWGCSLQTEYTVY